MAKLDLEGDFTGHKQALLLKVDAGKRTHTRKNIAESGHPFEQAFRELFSLTLPPTTHVFPGYFYNSALELSAQVDALFCDHSEALHLPPSIEVGQRYVPFHSVRVMVQIKNSASDLAAALKQSAAALEAWNRMRTNDLDFSSTGSSFDEPMSVIVIGNGGDLGAIQRALKKQAGPWPAYILLLEKGVLLGPDMPLRDAFEYENGEATADFFNKRNNVSLAQLRGNNSPEGSGRLLMWLYFAVLARTQCDRPSSAFSALTRSVAHHFPVVFIDGTTVTRISNPRPSSAPRMSA